MKIKRKQQNTNGVKSSTNTDTKLDSKIETNSDNKSDLKIENTKKELTKCETIKIDQTSNQLNKSIDKKDKMLSISNGTNNSPFLNGLTNSNVNNDIRNKSLNNLTIKNDVKNQIFKEKKKTNTTNVNKSIENNSGLNNQLNLTLNSLIENENIEDNFNKNLISDKLTNCDNKPDKINLSANLSIDNCALNNTLENKNLDLKNKNTLSADTSSKSNILTAKKRELDSDISNLKKKVKINNNKNIETKDVSTSTNNVSTITEPEFFGFVEPGTSVVLEGAVLDEIEGVLVVNVTWRGRTFVGTLLDCTKNEWSAPRFFCDSPTSDLESRGNIFRNRTSSKRPKCTENENNTKMQQSKLRNGKGRRNNFTVPVSPIRNSNQSENLINNKKGLNKLDNAVKRSSPPLDSNNCVNNLINGNLSSTLNSQPNQAPNQITPNSKNQLSSQIIECPEPNCNKKYKHINGLKYHQAHHHSTNNSSKLSTNNNSNKNEEINDLNKDNEDATDIEDSSDEVQLSIKSSKTSNKSSKSNKKQNIKESRTDSNKSPAVFSDISDDTENDSSRPSSNNSSNSNIQTSQLLTTNSIGAKNDELNLSTEKINFTSTSTSTNLNKSSGSSFSFFLPTSPSNQNLEDSLSKEEQKTNEELRKLASEVDQKISNDQNLDDQKLNSSNNSLISTENKLLLNNSSSIAPNNLLNTASLQTKLIPSSNNSFFSPNFSMDPAIHAYLVQTDLNYRINYERYLIENQEKLFNTLNPNELNEMEKERHKAFLLAHQQNAALSNLNNLNPINQTSNNKDSLFKLPSTNPSRPASTKSNDRPPSNSSLKAAGGSIVNGNSLSQQQQQQQNNKNPYDFQEFEKQFEKQREETFKLNSFRLEEQRLLNSRTPMPNTQNTNSPNQRLNSSPNKKQTFSTKEENYQPNNNSINKSKQDEVVKSQQNFINNFPFLNPSSTIAPTGLSNFPSTSIVHPHLPFDPNLLINQNPNSNAQMPPNLSQPFFNPLIDSLRLANAGLSPIDLNSTNNASKLLMPTSQQTPANLLNNNNNNNKKDSAYQERNGIYRTLVNNNLNQGSSTFLNTSNNSTSSKKDLDENRSPSRHLNNAQHVGAAGYPTPFIIDPFGELIQQAAASSACLIPSYASK